MKAGELQTCSGSSDVMAEKFDGNHGIEQHSEHHMNGTLPQGNETEETNDFQAKSTYQKLLHSLQCDQRIQWELALGKRIGFYSLRGELGSGNFSRVRGGIHTLTKERVAIKILDKGKMDKKTKHLLSREISSMEKLHHPHIIHLYEVIHTETKLNLVMEYASGGELFTKLSTHGKMSEAEARIVFAQIVSAVQHMHQHNVIHRDLKAENVFYSEKRFVKVGDFGFSTDAHSANDALNTFCGSPPYAAPELFRDSFYYGESVDIWALGILLYFTVTGTMPFRAETVGKLKKRILAGHFTIPNHVSSECKALIRGILKAVPSERFAISDIRCSEWLVRACYPQPMGYYRLEPTQINLKQCEPEEAYALCYLDKLGIGREQLKRFKFSAQENQSPFSWHQNNNATTTENSAIASKRSSASTLPIHSSSDQSIQINEFSALVGTYRILLLRAHRRFCGPAANDELRKLRLLTERAIAKFRDCDLEPCPTWSCSMCELKQSNGHAGNHRAVTASSANHSSGAQLAADQSRPEQKSRIKQMSWMNATFSAASTDRAKPERTSRNRSAPAHSGTPKSKLCVIL